MARTNKTGIDYFSFDVNFFYDEKIQFVSARFGTKGEAIAIRLLCKIYRNGYYTKWDDDTALLFAKGVGDGCQDSFVKDVVHELLKRGFFDRSIFERFYILTSRGIQNRYFEATKRYKQVDVIHEFLLIDVSKIDNVSIIANNANTNQINDSINSQKKGNEKETKGEIISALPPPTQTKFVKPTIEELKDFFYKKNFEKKLCWSPQKIDEKAEKFFNFYESKGWYVGKNKMKDWRAAISSQWLKENFSNYGTNRTNNQEALYGSNKEAGSYAGGF